MTDLLATIRAAGEPYGLNLVAAIPVKLYDASITSGLRACDLAPQSRSIVIIGNGGGRLWAALKEHVERNPQWWNREHPLDDFTREIIETSIVPPLLVEKARCTIVYPFIHEARTLNFVRLARIAGLTGPSIIGVSLHPQYGPWVAFRAALLIDKSVDAPGPAVNFDPCPDCTVRTCIKACPVNAVSIESGWDAFKCRTHRVELEQDCIDRCHARVACVIGPDSVYPDDQLAYLQQRSLRAMRPFYEAKNRK